MLSDHNKGATGQVRVQPGHRLNTLLCNPNYSEWPSQPEATAGLKVKVSQRDSNNIRLKIKDVGGKTFEYA